MEKLNDFLVSFYFPTKHNKFNIVSKIDIKGQL